MKETHAKLEASIPEINKLFKNEEFDFLLKDLEQYNKNVKKHYNEYLKTNEIWNKLKSDIATL
jgi:hypothetical protein